jgi:Uma2 family endonuclease
MVTSKHNYLPTAEDLPDSDETPVHNELQNDIPNLLLGILKWIWRDRSDWLWGIDMGIYYDLNVKNPKKSKPIVPDGFLVLGVPRRTDAGGRLSYVLWQEKVLPILVLEVVSHKYNGEYEEKLEKYEELGILYYLIYNPLSGRRGIHKRHQPLEVYKLTDGKYELMPSVLLLQADGGRMVWMPEISLGIGYEQRSQDNWQCEWVYWYDDNGRRYAERSEAAEERANTAEAIARQEQQENEKLAAYLKSLGIDPEQIP